MSSGPPKSGPPAHQNKFAFQHNRASRLTHKILSSPINNLCPTCTRVIQWRKQFRKYKPLSVPKRCCRCDGKAVKDAYHVICNGCAGKGNVCAKCLESRELDAGKAVLAAAESVVADDGGEE